MIYFFLSFILFPDRNQYLEGGGGKTIKNTEVLIFLSACLLKTFHLNKAKVFTVH